MRCIHASNTDLDKICDLLAVEFFDDPIYKFVFADKPGRSDRMWGFFRTYIDLAREYGGLLITENYAGVLVYFRPEFMDISHENPDIDNRLRLACGSDYKTIAEWMKGCDNWHPRTPPHYYLFLTAVQRTQRGKNGAAVFKTLLRELSIFLDKENTPCYSECTRRGCQIIARQFGFRDAAPPRCVEGFPEFYPIWRNPQQQMVSVL